MASDYQRPAIADLGSVQDLTLGHSDGDLTDQAFPVHTPKESLTFS